jgi:IS30 family transposase
MCHLAYEQRIIIYTLKRRGISNREIAAEINARPRKRYGYYSPVEIIYNLLT